MTRSLLPLFSRCLELACGLPGGKGNSEHLRLVYSAEFPMQWVNHAWTIPWEFLYKRDHRFSTAADWKQ